LTAAAQAADAASAAAGSYVALAKQSRVVDTRTGAAGNHRGALRAGQTIAVRVAGVGALPSTGVGSVVVTVTALRPTGTGSVVLYGASAPRTSNLSFAAPRRRGCRCRQRDGESDERDEPPARTKRRTHVLGVPASR
jgi:hypothetical protein